MSEIVRIALDHTENGRISWPKRCPRCGVTESLINVDARVGVQHKEGKFSFGLLTTLLRMRTEATEFSFLACQRHAFANEFAIRLLERSLLPSFGRGVVYLAVLLLGLSAFKVLKGETTLAALFDRGFGFTFFLLFGLVGITAIIWARKVASVWPVSMDQRTRVVSIKFSNDNYAKDFRRANARATHRLLTARPVFFLRPRFWGWVIFLAFLVFVFRQI